jgi:hypothetical protein
MACGDAVPTTYADAIQLKILEQQIRYKYVKFSTWHIWSNDGYCCAT